MHVASGLLFLWLILYKTITYLETQLKLNPIDDNGKIILIKKVQERSFCSNCTY
jgi:hypothetical protein